MLDFTKWLRLPEEPLKSAVKSEFFDDFDYTGDKIDFMLTKKTELFGDVPLLWAECKRGDKENIEDSITQLVATIGKYGFNLTQTPQYIGVFDASKFAFLPYGELLEIFVRSDVDWTMTPSNHKSEKFQHLKTILTPKIQKMMIFEFNKNADELRRFIAENLKFDISNIRKFQITKNNFFHNYLKWLKFVKPTISINWNLAKSKFGIIDADFYLADLLSSANTTLAQNLAIILKINRYEFMRNIDEMGALSVKTTSFNDGGKAHERFWAIYERPPREEFWEHILERRDMLVPQDIRERKGAFFTPQIWVEKAQICMAESFGENFQDEYYIWDCAAGTGNLLTGLTNKHNIFASTIDNADVAIIKERIKNGANLFENQIFQFDFLNDAFFDEPCEKHAKKGFYASCNLCVHSKIPPKLQEILRDNEKRKKLIIFINPPYAEAASASTVSKTGTNKPGVSTTNEANTKFKPLIKRAANELFALFFTRIYKEIDGCKLATFSKLKYINSQNFKDFRQMFLARFLGGFAILANTFDNVKGNFPIGFLVWDLDTKTKFRRVNLQFFDAKNKFVQNKKIYVREKKPINSWYSSFYDKKGYVVGIMNTRGNDFQNQNYIRISSLDNNNHTNAITPSNLLASCVYFAVRHAIKADWINDRDQFFAPNKNWQKDDEFKSDCLAFTLFHGQNRISCKEGTNHFIPFSEDEVGCKSAFESDFMFRFINGKHCQSDLFGTQSTNVKFGTHASELFVAGREFFSYYHEVAKCEHGYLPNASLYDIREFFQGRDKTGKMNAPQKSSDERYKELLVALQTNLNSLAKKIEGKIYEYEFLDE